MPSTAHSKIPDENNMMTHKIITHLDVAFIKAWKELWNKADNKTIFNSYDWCMAYKDIAHSKKIEIHALYNNDILVALLPLARYTVFGVPVWGTLCPERLVDTSLLMERYDRTLFRTFFGEIMKKRNVYLEKIDTKAAQYIHDLFPSSLVSLMSVNPIIDLTEKDPHATVSESTMAQIKRLLRKNEGKFRYEFHDTDLEKYFNQMLVMQKHTSKTAKAMDIFADKLNRDYYLSLIKHCGYAVRISFLYYEDTPIVYEYGLFNGDSYLGEQIAYHNDYKKLSPGKIMLYYLLHTLTKLNVKTLDQGGGISNYKQLFSHEYRTLYNVYASNNLFIMLWWRAINAVRRLKQIRFPKEHTRDHEFLFRTFKGKLL